MRLSDTLATAPEMAHWRRPQKRQSGMKQKQESTAALKTAGETDVAEEQRHPLLVALGEQVRAIRTQRDLTRKKVARAAGVSERHLANLEYGIGNVSILLLHQVSTALQCSLTDLLDDAVTRSPHWLQIRKLLEHRSDGELRRVRLTIEELLGVGEADPARRRRIALIGLRGAGKSTLGRMLADDLGLPFVELSSVIEKTAGCNVREIHNLYGANAYHRYECRAIEETIQSHGEAVIATPGSLVSNPAAFGTLLAHCTTVWLQAVPKEHLARVAAQEDDAHQMMQNREAIEDLRHALDERSAFYAKADLAVDTSGRTRLQSFEQLRDVVRQIMGLPAFVQTLTTTDRS